MARQARHEVLVVSDSDIVVGARLSATHRRRSGASRRGPCDLPLSRDRRCRPLGAAGAAAIDYHFLPNVLVGLKLGLAAPCFGSTIALRRETLAEIGGFEAVADQLADDYALGALVRRTGLRVAIPNNIVAHVCAERSARDLYPSRIPLGADDPLHRSAGLFRTGDYPRRAARAASVSLLGGVNAAGFIVVAALACRLMLQSELDRAFRLPGKFFWLGPLRDVLSFVIFVMSFFGRGVEWRGHRYGRRAGNRLAYYGEVET